MTKSQIIEILEKKVDYIEGITFDELADAILALPIETPTYELVDTGIEMPSEEEIKNYFTKEHYHYEKGRYTKVDKDRIYGAKWMKDEIIKRN